MLRTIFYYLTIVVIFLFTQACKPVVMLYLGAHKPKAETVKSLHKEVEKLVNGTVEKIYVYNSLRNRASSDSAINRLPTAILFSKDGLFVPYRPDSVDCSGPLSVFLQNIEKEPRLVDSTKNFGYYAYHVIDAFTHEPLELEELPEADYYLLITWARHIGKLNKRAISWLKLAEVAEETRGVRIHPILLSLDIMYFWPEVHGQAFKF